MTPNSSQITKPTAYFWVALELYMEAAQKCSVYFADQVRLGDMTGGIAAILDSNKERLIAHRAGLKLSQALFAQRQEIDDWLLMVGKKHGDARMKYTTTDLDWVCLLWTFAPHMINVLIPEKDHLVQTLRETLDQIARGKRRGKRHRPGLLSYGRHVEVDVTSFAGSRKKVQLSTRARNSRAPSTSTVLYSTDESRKKDER